MKTSHFHAALTRVGIAVLLCFNTGSLASPAPTPTPSSDSTPTASPVLMSIPGCSASALQVIEQSIPDGRGSPYSPLLPRVLKRWPPKELASIKETESPVWMAAVRNAAKDTYIGVIKRLRFRAPISRVRAVMDKFEDYVNIFKDLKEAKILEKRGNLTTTFWERNSPVFFVPNVKYEQSYLTSACSESKSIIRYQLTKSDSVNYADGLIIIEAEGNSTLLTAWDFFDAKWGILGGLALGRIWRESLENSFKGDVAMKLKIENPDWSLQRITEEAERKLKQFPIEPIRYVDNIEW